MRTATLRLVPDEDAPHPLGSVPRRQSDLEPEAIDDLAGLADGTLVLLCRLRGSRRSLERAFSRAERVHGFDVTAVGPTLHLHAHVEPTGVLAALRDLQRDHEVVVRTPVRWFGDGRLEISTVGDDAALQRAVGCLSDDVGVELLDIRTYRPETDGFETSLTDRQLEVLDAALDVGYYDVPRAATHADVGEAVGLAPATVGEHLRRVERTVLRGVRG